MVILKAMIWGVIGAGVTVIGWTALDCIMEWAGYTPSVKNYVTVFCSGLSASSITYFWTHY